MAGVAVSVDLSPVVKAVEGFGLKIDWLPLHRKVAVLMATSTKKNFERSSAPDGTPWPPLKRGQRKPLIKSGALMAAATSAFAAGRSRGDDFVYEVDTPYGSFHQEGTRTIPKREFLGVSEDMGLALSRMASEHVIEQATKGYKA